MDGAKMFKEIICIIPKNMGIDIFQLHSPITGVQPGNPNAVTYLSVDAPSQTPLPFVSRYQVPSL